MMSKIEIVIGLIICILYSCGNENTKLETVHLKKLSAINQLADSTFILDVRSISYANKKIYLTDYKRNQIIILDEGLNMINSLGRGGKGPGEFVGAAQISLSDDSIYVINDGKQTIEVFGETGYIKSIPFPQSSNRFETSKRFIISNNKFYLSHVTVNSTISICKPPDIKKTFGVIKKYTSPKETLIKNENHILAFENTIIAVSDNRPVVELYDTDGNIISKFNYGNIDLVGDMMSFIDEKEMAENSYFVLVPDAYVLSNKLYLLLLTQIKGKVMSNKILEIELKNKIIIPLRIIDLGDGWFESFCVSDDNVVAFDSNSNELISFQFYD